MSYVISICTASSTEKEASKDDKKIVKRDRSKSATRKEELAQDETVPMEIAGDIKDKVTINSGIFLHFSLKYF